MKCTRSITVGLVLCVLFAPIAKAAAQASSGSAPAGLTEWQPGRVPGSGVMLLLGDPSKPELFVTRFRYPDGLRVGPHGHTTSVHITVLNGTLMLGMGDAFDSTHAQAYGPGSFVLLEGGMHHYEWFRGAVTIHVEGIGPFNTVFLNPADDRRRKT